MKKICFVSLSRSDYTSLMPLIKAALKDTSFETKVVVGGSHLLKRFGESIKNFAQDGIPIHESIEFLEENDNTDLDMARAFGRAYPKFVEYFAKEKPDYVFILGDRFEMLSATIAASLLRIPIIHHSGGDLTQGSADNQTRYALSTQSHFHLVALPEHAQRLISMGEEAWRVVVTGEPALTEIKTKGVDTNELYAKLGFADSESFVLATFHPTSFDSEPLEKQIDLFIETLKNIKEKIVLTAPNPDPGSLVFFQKLKDLAKNHPHIYFFENLGAKYYYGAMSKAKYMVGNSSSGIWEAPSFALPVLNMGNRQDGRLRALNVVDAKLDIAEILEALSKVSHPSFNEKIKNIKNPYGHEETNQMILNAIRSLPTKERLLAKKLIDPLELVRLRT